MRGQGSKKPKSSAQNWSQGGPQLEAPFAPETQSPVLSPKPGALHTASQTPWGRCCHRPIWQVTKQRLRKAKPLPLDTRLTGMPPVPSRIHQPPELPPEGVEKPGRQGNCSWPPGLPANTDAVTHSFPLLLSLPFMEGLCPRSDLPFGSALWCLIHTPEENCCLQLPSTGPVG